MKDSLKNYIDENRDGFEIFNDDFDTSWQEIDKRLSKQKRKAQFNIIWKVAAAVALWALVGVGALKFYYAGTESNRNSFVENSEFLETEQYYNRLIQEKIEIIEAKQGKVKPEILKNVAQLDIIYEELRKDLADQANNEEVIKAMIEHQRLKLSVLEQILENLEKNDHENIPHGL